MTTEPANHPTGSSVSEGDITRFVIDRFLPGTPEHELTPDFDLQSTGVLDSLAVLRIAAWLEAEHGVTLPDTSMTVRHFRSVATIRDTAARAQAATAAATPASDPAVAASEQRDAAR